MTETSIISSSAGYVWVLFFVCIYCYFCSVVVYSLMFLTESITLNGFEGENISFTFTSGLDLRWTVLACIYVCFLGLNCYKMKTV